MTDNDVQDIRRDIRALSDWVQSIAKDVEKQDSRIKAIQSDLWEIDREERSANGDVLERLTEAVELIGECVRRDPFGAPYLAIGGGDGR